jgi:hypothetical protein
LITYKRKMPRSKTMNLKEMELLKQYAKDSPTRERKFNEESINNSKHQFKKMAGAKTERQL